MSKLLWADNDWDFDLISKTLAEVEEIGVKEMGLDIYPNQIEIITADQMLDAYASHAMPVMYNHWSFGKTYSYQKKMYEKGEMGLAYEVVINSNPCISYLMEENTMTMQALVLAHAAIGHNNYFKTNYLFQQWTDAEGIIDYLSFAKKYIRNCEERYGVERVETFLDSCHAMMNYGMDRFKRARRKTKEEQRKRAEEREAYYQSRISELWPNFGQKSTPSDTDRRKKMMLPEPEDNILYFIEKNSPILETWEREIVRIVRKVAQYFWPQMQTQVGNEGWASFNHYTIMNRMYEKGLISEGSYFEFIRSHSGVIAQRVQSAFNPYCLGFNIFRDIRRICEEPTAEDKRWFPHLIGENYLDVAKDAVANYKDESFILQFLSPKVIRDLKMFTILDDISVDNYNYIVKDIHDEQGYRQLRHDLSQQYDINRRMPQIQIVDVDVDGDRTLYLKHTRHNNVPLNDDLDELEQVLKHLRRLWGFQIVLKSYHSGQSYPEVPAKIYSI